MKKRKTIGFFKDFFFLKKRGGCVRRIKQMTIGCLFGVGKTWRNKRNCERRGFAIGRV